METQNIDTQASDQINMFSNNIIPENLYTMSGNTISGIKSGIDKSMITELVIPSEINGITVKMIGQQAFGGLSNLETVVIESSIESVGESAFYNCTSLKTFPFDKIKDSIGRRAFMSCQSLTEVLLADTISSIGLEAFMNCSKIERLHIPDNALYTVIKEYTFFNLAITTVDIPSNITSIEGNAFGDCKSLANVSFPSGLKTMGRAAFQRSAIETLVLPDSVTSIDMFTFGSCPQLKSVVWGKGAPEIAMYAFVNSTRLKSLTLPNTLKTIGYGAFDAGVNASIGDGLETVIIPASVTNIGASAFARNSLKKIILESPNSINFSSGTPKAFALQNIMLQLYQTDQGYYIDFQAAGIDDYKKITLTNASVDSFEKVKDGIFKLKDSENIPLTISYSYNLVEGNDNSVVTANNAKLVTQKVYTTVFQETDGTIIDSYYKLFDDEVVLPSVEKKGFTALWDEGVKTEFKRVYTVTYKALPKVTVKNAVLALHAEFNPLDYISAIDADGNNITHIDILTNNVETSREGDYVVTFRLSDKWGGIYEGEVLVHISGEQWQMRELIDTNTQLKVKAIMPTSSYLDVKTLKPEESVLSKVSDNNLTVLKCYEVKIVDKYRGNISVTFSIPEKYNGHKIIIRYLNKDHMIESYEVIANNNEVMIEVSELSQFLLLAEKDMTNLPAKPDKPNNPDNSNNAGSDKKEETVITSDQTKIRGLAIIGLISLLSIVVIVRERKKDRLNHH